MQTALALIGWNKAGFELIEISGWLLRNRIGTLS
jgi:hypothetical protein